MNRFLESREKLTPKEIEREKKIWETMCRLRKLETGEFTRQDYNEEDEIRHKELKNLHVNLHAKLDPSLSIPILLENADAAALKLISQGSKFMKSYNALQSVKSPLDIMQIQRIGKSFFPTDDPQAQHKVGSAVVRLLYANTHPDYTSWNGYYLTADKCLKEVYPPEKEAKQNILNRLGRMISAMFKTSGFYHE